MWVFSVVSSGSQLQREAIHTSRSTQIYGDINIKLLFLSSDLSRFQHVGRTNHHLSVLSFLLIYRSQQLNHIIFMLMLSLIHCGWVLEDVNGLCSRVNRSVNEEPASTKCEFEHYMGQYAYIHTHTNT